MIQTSRAKGIPKESPTKAIGITEPGVGTNRYGYAGNDPVNASDPGGNDTWMEYVQWQEDSWQLDSERASAVGTSNSSGRLDAWQSSLNHQEADLALLRTEQDTGGGLFGPDSTFTSPWLSILLPSKWRMADRHRLSALKWRKLLPRQATSEGAVSKPTGRRTKSRSMPKSASTGRKGLELRGKLPLQGPMAGDHDAILFAQTR